MGSNPTIGRTEGRLDVDALARNGGAEPVALYRVSRPGDTLAP
jgi:hypothetical protein